MDEKAKRAVADHLFFADGRIAALIAALDVLICLLPGEEAARRAIAQAIENHIAIGNGEGASDAFLNGLRNVQGTLRGQDPI